MSNIKKKKKKIFNLYEIVDVDLNLVQLKWKD